MRIWERKRRRKFQIDAKENQKDGLNCMMICIGIGVSLILGKYVAFVGVFLFLLGMYHLIKHHQLKKKIEKIDGKVKI